MKYKTKYQVLVDRYQDGLKGISSSTEAWKNFLESAAYTYVQPFRNEVVLHQRAPHIKAAATYNDWQKLNRYVLGGKHGIPVFDPRRAGQVTYVFDFKDTAAYRNLNAILPWTVYSDKSGSALHNMLKRGNARTLNSYIHARVSEVVTEGAKQSAPPELTRCLEQSVRYVLHIRLDLPTGGLDVSDFAFVTRFSTQPAAVEKLGHLLHESMKACLHPLRSVAYSMHMTMPAPEEIAVQAKQQEPSAAPAAEAAPPLPDLTKVPVRLDGDTITIGHGEATHEIDVTVSDEDHATMVELAKAKQPVKHRPLQAAPDVRYEQLSLDEAPAQNAAKDYGFEYQLLDRLRTDCDYFLGAGSRLEKHLWAGSVRGQIAKMRELYDRLPEKPEWLTLDDINKYAQRMAPQYQVVVYHHSENGLDERREYQTLAAAEHAAQKYLDGTMDGENGFAYEGAGVYDLQARRLVKTLGNFPAEQAVGIDNLEDIKNGLEKELQQDKATQEIVPGAEANAVFPDSAADHAVEIPIDGEWKKFQTVKEAEHAAYQEWIKEGRKNAVNYISTGDAIPSGGPKARFQDNIAALRLLQHLDATGQQALPDQQRGLARYVGWGGLADAFDGTNADWAEEYKTLKELLPAQEYEAARASTLTSFYTPPEIIRPIYETLERFGLKGGNILEPSMGVGAFFSNLPKSFDTNSTRLYGVELDPVTGRIAQQLFPKANIQIAGYEKASLPDGCFDVVVGNVPFGQYKVNDPSFNRYNFFIHDYFAAKNIDKLRVGGIQAIITTSGTLDKRGEDVRKYLAARCDLIGAVRLPDTAFKAVAGTEVTADILFLQKRDGILTTPEADWLHVDQTADGIPMNRYFIDHPEMVCGRMEMVSGPYGPRPTCKPDTDTSLEEQLRTAMGHLQAVLPDWAPLPMESAQKEASSIPADPDVRNFSFCVRNEKIYYRRNSCMEECALNAVSKQRVSGMVSLLATTRELIQAQLDDQPADAIAQLQNRLSSQYDEYTRKYGRLNSRANSLAFREDSGYSLLCSLEKLDNEGNFVGKADIFTKRTISPACAVDHVDTASDALLVSLSERGRIDWTYMQQLSGKTQEDLLKDLTGIVFRVPGAVNADGTPVYQPGEEYLSGNVRQKLADARQAAALDPTYQVNVDALITVQPKDLTASEIEVHLGTTWIPAEDIRQFALELMRPNAWVAKRIKVTYEPYTAHWNVSGGRLDMGIRASTTYGTKRRSFYDLLQCSLNLQSVKVVDYVEDPDGKKRAVPNVKETRLAQDKQMQIEREFRDWIYRDPERRRRLVAYYNEHYNNIRPREYDGSFLTFPGMNPEITLRPHQRNAVARILFGGNTLIAHVVGAGKTKVMGAAAMKKKSLGLCSKTLIGVPNHLTEQVGAELQELYPSANILVAKKSDFEENNRKLFCSRIATGDYDIVIIGHSQFGRLPLSEERQERFLQDEIDQFTEAINEAKREKSGKDLTVKQMETARKRLTVRLEKLMASPKDNVVNFEDLGVDSLMIDEAHLFKNLAVQTKMQNVAGITTAESQKATDLLMKCQYLDEITGSKGTTFCTGTPISNSAAELYTMMRYLQAKTLREHGIYTFDAWAANFGETTTAMELAPEGTGYRMKTRFSRFHNLPELINMWKLAADIQTADMLQLPVPSVEGGKPTVVMCPPTELQKQTIQALGERAEKVRAGIVDPHEDNMLKITTDGRKLALDQRMLNPDLPDDPGNKANACANKVYEIWEQTKEQKSTQLIFSDLATPGTGAWNVYDDIRDKLVAKGIPKEEIAYIHDATTDTKKSALFARVRAGKVRVLLGSTQKMGAGTNVQTKLIALHHLDVPWRPADIEQREGRILRQGNENIVVQIYRYATEGSFDAYSWQLIENKQRFISQVMSGHVPARSCEDVDEATLSYAEVKALCAGNPLIKEKMDLDNEVARLSTLRSAHNTQIYELQDALAIRYPAKLVELDETLARFTKDAAAYSASYHEDADGQEVFAATIQGVPYTKRTDADAALIEACKAAIHGDTVIGQYCGFDIHAYYNPSRSAFSGYLQGAGKYEFDYLGKQNFQQLQRILKSLPDGIEAVNSSKDTVLKDIESAKEAVRQPFTYEAEFQTKLARLNELNILLDQEQSGKEQNMNNPETYQQYLEHRARTDSADRLPPDVEDAARQAGLTVQRDQDKPGAAYFDAGQNVIHVSDAGSEADVRLSELKGYADAVIQRTATVEPPIRDLESASLAVMLAARYDIGVSDRLSQQLASAHAEAVKCPAFDLPVTLQRLDKAMDYCDHFLAHEQERELVQEAENAQEPEQMQELSPQSQAFMMDM